MRDARVPAARTGGTRVLLRPRAFYQHA